MKNALFPKRQKPSFFWYHDTEEGQWLTSWSQVPNLVPLAFWNPESTPSLLIICPWYSASPKRTSNFPFILQTFTSTNLGSRLASFSQKEWEKNKSKKLYSSHCRPRRQERGLWASSRMRTPRQKKAPSPRHPAAELAGADFTRRSVVCFPPDPRRAPGARGV